MFLNTEDFTKRINEESARETDRERKTESGGN